MAPLSLAVPKDSPCGSRSTPLSIDRGLLSSLLLPRFARLDQCRATHRTAPPGGGTIGGDQM